VQEHPVQRAQHSPAPAANALSDLADPWSARKTRHARFLSFDAKVSTSFLA
jgi:hypothetical protein